jgi:hypothetical protein
MSSRKSGVREKQARLDGGRLDHGTLRCVYLTKDGIESTHKVSLAAHKRLKVIELVSSRSGLLIQAKCCIITYVYFPSVVISST